MRRPRHEYLHPSQLHFQAGLTKSRCRKNNRRLSGYLRRFPPHRQRIKRIQGTPRKPENKD